MVRYVYDFAEGRSGMADLLGGKGAGLAGMTRLGLPVPPGFTVTTEACRAYRATGAPPRGLDTEIAGHLAVLEDATGRRLGDPVDPLLLAVRPGAPSSTPGTAETVLGIGLNDDTVLGLAKLCGRERFAWDSYRRLIQMFGTTVMGVDADRFAHVLAHRQDVLEPARLVGEFKNLVHALTGEDFPEAPAEQLRRAILVALDSRNGERADRHRRGAHIPDGMDTAVNVQAMVFGNLGPDSGAGVAFTHDPATGLPGVHGDYLPEAQGEDVVTGVRDPVPLDALRRLDPAAYDRLCAHLQVLEAHYKDMCEVEFTIEAGRLWLLRTRIGERTAEAAFRIADRLVDEGVIEPGEALRRVDGARLSRLLLPRFGSTAEARLVARGIPASPGAATGAVVFDSAEAERRAAAGKKTVLVRRETTPDDLPGLLAAQAVLTSRGGMAGHAAVVARSTGTVCVCGAHEITVDTDAGAFTAKDGTEVTEGTVVSVDGAAGTVHLGELPLVPSQVTRRLMTGEEAGEAAEAVARVLRHADLARRMGVRADADTPEDARLARRFGAEGIGLCRTERTFLGPRRRLVEELILASTEGERRRALAALLPLQRQDFIAVLEAMDGLPVTIRLLDPPLHAFLPDRTELAVRVATAEATGDVPDPRDRRLLEATERLHEENPVLGLRGVRLCLAVPGLVDMQVRALGEAVVQRLAEGGIPRPQIMIPLVGTADELRLVREEVEAVLAEVSDATGVSVRCPIGTMIELPRAALTADRIAAFADFFSFGAEDLTQSTWGLSRDDAESSFLPVYLARGVLRDSPFETLDTGGVGRLVRTALTEGRAAHPGLETGVCGGPGDDPASMRFFHGAGVDHVSCAPHRVPVARLEAARAALADRPSDV